MAYNDGQIAQLNAFAKQMQEDTEAKLHEDLQPYIIEREGIAHVLNHPLVVQAFIIPGAANRQYEHRLAQLAQPKYEDPQHRIWLYERPYRLPTVLDWIDEESYVVTRELFGQVWIDGEYSITIEDELGARTLEAFRQFDYITDEAGLGRPDEPIPVYRAGKPLGMSWTTNKEVAYWFSGRNKVLGKVTTVWEATCVPDNVLAHLLSRNEAEIICDPTTLEGVKDITKDFKCVG